MPGDIVATWRSWWGVAIGLLMLAAPRPALARPSVALTEVRLIKAPPALRAEIEKAMLSSLVALGYRVVAPKQVRAHPKYQPSCTSGPCLSEIGRVLKADYVLHCAIAAHGSSNYEVNLTLYETASGSTLAQVQSQCSVCTYADVTKRVVAATQRLDKRARAVTASRAWLSVRSDPSGADVRLDRVAVGRTPLRRLLAPGVHQVTVHKAGLSAGRKIRLSAGTKRTVTLKLGLGLKRPLAPPRRLESWWIGWVGVGVGAAATTAGAIFAGLAGNCVGDCEHDRRTLGIGLIGSGAALMAAGVFALIVDRWQRKSGRARLPRHPAPIAVGIDPIARSVAVRLRY